MHPLPNDSSLKCDFHDEETLVIEGEKQYSKMYFDGASSIQLPIRPKISKVRVGIRLIFTALEGGILRYSHFLLRLCINNVVEYDALLAGLELAIKIGIQSLHIYGDSQLNINQVKVIFKTYIQELL